ncbi:ABC transporter substrate-binding protein [Humibacter ginsenosidimutans]|uniref:Sugar ABC transporter substrate-binding protein n=1 Tax=Humibacter ginsenosidimutans TaxID=2599293 RepID=A0A5B8M6R3_9MICO|nr:sugar ABC transporter substrate-binding protein [Humibacter ginsenosidimutans]QDZ15674.1 sugar ABC transporter substrate-binding protein [Humibacter ginsenosidimutans]
MKRSRTVLAAAVASVALAALAGCSSGTPSSGDSGGKVTVSFRTWDTNAAAAYKTSFAEFHKKNPDITVKVDVVPWANYFTKLRTDIAGGSADDIFWINGSSYNSYASNGDLIDINKMYGSDFSTVKKTWVSGVVDQFTQDGSLWGVPQTSDGGIALYYNEDLLKAAGLSESDISKLTWSPDGGGDTLLSVAKKLTKDSSGKTADQAGFNGSSLAQYGYGASQDLQAQFLPFVGSNGGTYQTKDGKFTFTNPKTVEAVQYIVDLINKYHVAPSAADTNTNGNFTLDAFTQGKEALFQSGLYNLANVQSAVKFHWGVVMQPAGPAGAVSVSNGIAAVGNAKSSHLAATEKVLKWIATKEGNSPIGASGANLPAVTAAQQVYFDYWKGKDVDVSPFFDVIKENPTIPAPIGANYNAASTAAGPFINSVFLGQVPVAQGLKSANTAANAVVG